VISITMSSDQPALAVPATELENRQCDGHVEQPGVVRPELADLEAHPPLPVVVRVVLGVVGDRHGEVVDALEQGKGVDLEVDRARTVDESEGLAGEPGAGAPHELAVHGVDPEAHDDVLQRLVRRRTRCGSRRAAAW
jgi:hypothetical protein